MEQEKKKRVHTELHKQRVGEGNRNLTKVRKIVFGWKAGYSIDDIATLLGDTGEGCMDAVGDWMTKHPDELGCKRLNVVPGRGEVFDFVDTLRYHKCKRTKRGKKQDWVAFFSRREEGDAPFDPNEVDLSPVDPELLQELVHEVVEEHKAARLAREQRHAELIAGEFERMADEIVDDALDQVVRKLEASLVLLKQAQAER